MGESLNQPSSVKDDCPMGCKLLGQLLLRLIPTSMHTLEDVKYTIKAFKNVAEKLAKGEYNKELLIDASKL